MFDRIIAAPAVIEICTDTSPIKFLFCQIGVRISLFHTEVRCSVVNPSFHKVQKSCFAIFKVMFYLSLQLLHFILNVVQVHQNYHKPGQNFRRHSRLLMLTLLRCFLVRSLHFLVPLQVSTRRPKPFLCPSNFTNYGGIAKPHLRCHLILYTHCYP